MGSSNRRTRVGQSFRKRSFSLLLAGCVGIAALVASLSAPASTSARIAVCAKTGTAYVVWPRQHRDPLYGQNNPQPDGCWIPEDLYSNNGYAFFDCSVNPYPTIKTSSYGSAPQTYTYDDTSPSHSSPDESTTIKSKCLGSVSTLGVEMEAPGSGCPGSPSFQDRHTGFSVGVYLKEIYCSSDSARDSIACSISASHSCLINAGADVPTQYGGPCTAGISTCRTRMADDFESACANLASGDAIGVYGDYALSYNDGGTDDAKLVASWINASLNDCFYNLT
jgi:hypothetical protein